MSLKDREIAILEYLRTKKSASVSELCEALFVSEPTMRRDLAALNTAGKIIRTHGGAIYRNEPGENLPLAYAYVPYQQFEKPYSKEMALKAGTIFPSLNKPLGVYGKEFTGRMGDKQ